MSDDSEPNPWRDIKFRWFATGNVANNVGDGIFDIALPLLIYERTGSVLVMGLVAAVVPATLLLGPPLGTWADRRGAGGLIVWGLVLQLVAAVLLSLIVSVQQMALALFLPLVVAMQLGGAVYRMGWMTSVPSIFPQSAVRARGNLSSLFIATTLAGPLFVGALLPLTGYASLLWINCITFLAPLLVHAAGIRPSKPERGHRIGRPVLDGVRVGIAVLRDERVLRRLTFLLLPFEFVISAAIPTLAIYHLRNSFGIPASAVAMLFVMINSAALVGSLGVSQRRVFQPQRLVRFVTLLAALALLAVAIPSAVVVVVALTLLMLLSGAADAAQAMMVVHFVPQEVFGRASGVLRLIHGVPSVLGPPVGAAIVNGLGPRIAFGTMAVVAFTSAVLMLATSPAQSSRPVGGNH